MQLPLFVTCPKGIEGLLLNELSALGATHCKETAGAIHCSATLETMYRICLWSRVANRVYLRLLGGEASSAKELYDLCNAYRWHTLLQPGSTLAVDFKGSSDFIRNTVFGAQLVKDAIVDQLRATTGERCTVDLQNPQCLIHARLHNGVLSVYYDLSGHSLHQRGYRKEAGAAPLKENVAAALLMRAGWPEMMTQPLIDPFCGSGTLLIEAAMMATHKAPGLDRLDYGFVHWQKHEPALWERLQEEALNKHEAALDETMPVMVGFDADAAVLEVAKRNIRAAGLSEVITLERRDIGNFALPEACLNMKGLIVCNPPYGERLGEASDLVPVYAALGAAIKSSGYKGAVLTSDPELARATRLRSHKQYGLMNGKIACKLYLFEVY